MSVLETERPREQRIIKVGEIAIEGSPKRNKTPCACGGMLIYQTKPLSTSWNGIQLEVESVWGYRCDGCTVTLLLPEVSHEVERYIDKALGRTQ